MIQKIIPHEQAAEHILQDCGLYSPSRHAHRPSRTVKIPCNSLTQKILGLEMVSNAFKKKKEGGGLMLKKG